MAQRILISGGSGGIGQATALMAARQGWDVALTYLGGKDRADDTARHIAAMGGRALAFHADTTNETDVSACFDAVIEQFRGLDAVIVNAGIVAPPAALAQIDTARLRRVFDTNILGAFLFAREAARRLPTSATPGKGAITLVSSVAARLGSPNEYIDYAASKGAVDTLTIGLSRELAPQGIRVNAVRPGLIDTPIHASGGQPDRAHRLGATVPLARPGTADEVASALLWLSSSAASYVTGALLDVGGGR